MHTRVYTHIYVYAWVCIDRVGWLYQGPRPIALMQQEVWSKLGQLAFSPTEHCSRAQFHWLSKDYCSVAQRLLWLEQNTHYCAWCQSHTNTSEDPDSSKGARMPPKTGQGEEQEAAKTPKQSLAIQGGVLSTIWASVASPCLGVLGLCSHPLGCHARRIVCAALCDSLWWTAWHFWGLPLK